MEGHAVAKPKLGFELDRPEEGPTDFEAMPVVQTLLKTADFLLELQDGPKYKPVLAERLEVSKSTVYNWARELLTHNIIEKSSAGYRLTTIGRAQVALFSQWQEASRRAHLLEPALVAMPQDSTPPEQLFWNADVLSNTESISIALADWLHHTTSLRGLAPKAMVEGLRVIPSVFDPNTVVEFVVRPHLFEYIGEAGQTITAPVWKGMDTSLLKVEGPFSFALFIRDRPDPALAILLYSDAGYAKTLLVTDTETALTWGHEVYEHYRP